jgi:hypothetical protein
MPRSDRTARSKSLAALEKLHRDLARAFEQDPIIRLNEREQSPRMRACSNRNGGQTLGPLQLRFWHLTWFRISSELRKRSGRGRHAEGNMTDRCRPKLPTQSVLFRQKDPAIDRRTNHVVMFFVKQTNAYDTESTGVAWS